MRELAEEKRQAHERALASDPAYEEEASKYELSDWDFDDGLYRLIEPGAHERELDMKLRDLDRVTPLYGDKESPTAERLRREVAEGKLDEVEAKKAGLKLITWTIERSGPLMSGGGWYYQSTKDAIDSDGKMYELIDVLAQEVGVEGIFSDWPGTVTFYASCMKLN